MRMLLAAAPVLALLAGPAFGQSAYPSTTAPRTTTPSLAPGEVDTSPRDFTPTRDMIGKRVMYRYGEGVAGTVQDIATGSDGRPAIALKVPNSNQPLILGASSFERRGGTLVLLHDRGEVAQLIEYERQGMTSYGRSTGDANSGTLSPSMGSPSMGSPGMGTPGSGLGQ